MIEIVRALSVTTLSAVEGIGVVHPFQRFAQNPPDLKRFYLTPTGRLHGWYVEWIKKTENHDGNRRYTVQNHIRLQGYCGWEDSSESQIFFDNLIERISDAFRNSREFPKSRLLVHGVNLVRAQPVMFAGVLCHAGELELITQHKEGGKA